MTGGQASHTLDAKGGLQRDGLLVAVTGASGYVAGPLIARLLRDGFCVRALSRAGTGRRDVEDYPVDYADGAALRAALQQVDTVIHLAARAHHFAPTHNAEEDAQLFRQANVDVTRAIASAAASAGVRRVVYLSSIGVNGSWTPEKAFSVRDAPNPVELYAKSKWETERLLASMLAQEGTDYVILRSPLVYGPGCPGNLDRLLRLVDKLPFLPLGGLRAPLTLLGIDNLVDALLAAMTPPKLARQTYLLADARATSIGEVIRLWAKSFGKPGWFAWPLPPAVLGALAGVAGKQKVWQKLSRPLQVDGSDFQRDAGWFPPHALEEGLERMAYYYRATTLHPEWMRRR